MRHPALGHVQLHGGRRGEGAKPVVGVSHPQPGGDSGEEGSDMKKQSTAQRHCGCVGLACKTCAERDIVRAIGERGNQVAHIFWAMLSIGVKSDDVARPDDRESVRQAGLESRTLPEVAGMTENRDRVLAADLVRTVDRTIVYDDDFTTKLQKTAHDATDDLGFVVGGDDDAGLAEWPHTPYPIPMTTPTQRTHRPGTAGSRRRRAHRSTHPLLLVTPPPALWTASAHAAYSLPNGDAPRRGARVEAE